MKESDWNFSTYAIWGIGGFVWSMSNLASPYKWIGVGFYLCVAVFYNIMGRIDYAKGN